jgi:anaerobic magnesium-protoporphyrin IX monomethyl ester cyclase
MRVLLVYPNMRGMNMLPPAIALFSRLLKEEGHEVALFDSTDYPGLESESINSDKKKEVNLNSRPFDSSKLDQSRKEENVLEAYRRRVEYFAPDLLAFSCTEDMFPIGIALLEYAQQIRVPTIFGGVFPTFAGDICLEHQQIDMVCIGEGETVLVELCRRMSRGDAYDDIPGLWVKKQDGTVKKNPMGTVVNMNDNPVLDLSIFDEGRLYRPMQGRVWKMFPLETHRGCPYKCAFCNSPAQWNMYREETDSLHFRKKSFEKIREEIIFFRDHHDVEAFYFWADTFFAYSAKEFDEFIEMYSEFKIPFWCQTRPETVTLERVEQLAKIGMFRIAFGVEHGNEEFRRKYIRRDISNERIINAMQLMDSTGIPYSVNNILGFPFETRELTFDTIDLNRHFTPDSQNAYSFSPFHGTELRALAEREKLIDKNAIARSITRPTILDMPQYSASSIEGMRRCFLLYVKLPKKRWPELQRAEALTPEGDSIWRQLRDEVEEAYMKPLWNSKSLNFEEMAMGLS